MYVSLIFSDLDVLINRVICRGGMIAPMLGGALLSINNSVPVYASIVIFVLAGLCVLLLHEERKERSAGRARMH